MVLGFALRCLKDIVECEPSPLSGDTRLDCDLELESIQLVEFQVALEDEYDIELDPMTLLELNSLKDIVKHVVARISDRSQRLPTTTS